MVHRRSRAPALGGLWPAAHRRRGDALADDPVVLASLVGYILVYSLIYSFGVVYFYRLMRDGLTQKTVPAAGYGLNVETIS